MTPGERRAHATAALHAPELRRLAAEHPSAVLLVAVEGRQRPEAPALGRERTALGVEVAAVDRDALDAWGVGPSTRDALDGPAGEPGAPWRWCVVLSAAGALAVPLVWVPRPLGARTVTRGAA